MTAQIIAFFENIPSWQRTLILAGGLLLFWVIEGIVPILKTRYPRVRHLGVNLVFTMTTLLINLAFAAIIILVSQWSTGHGFGLLQWVAMPVGLQILAGLLLMDLVGAYLIHLIEHNMYWMWRFHVVHHTDMHVDTTTALRHHPGESVFRAVFTILAVALAGAPAWLVMMYQSLSAFASQFNHANFHIHPILEKYLRWIIVTPGMHRVHHHQTQPYTDSNYGNVFAIWDRLFGTYAALKADQIVYGLDVYHKSDYDVMQLLKVPVDSENYHHRYLENDEKPESS